MTVSVYLVAEGYVFTEKVVTENVSSHGVRLLTRPHQAKTRKVCHYVES